MSTILTRLLVCATALRVRAMAIGNGTSDCTAEWGACTTDADCCKPSANGNAVLCSDNNGQMQCTFSHPEAICGTSWYMTDTAGCCEPIGAVYDFSTSLCFSCTVPTAYVAVLSSAAVGIENAANYPNALKTNVQYVDDPHCPSSKPWCDYTTMPYGVYGCDGHTQYCIAPSHWNCGTAYYL